MNLQSGSTTTIEDPGACYESRIRLQGTWLVTARVAWVALTLLALTLYVARIPF